VGADAEPPARSTGSDPADSGDAERWRCERCGRAHDFEPITCVACGAAEVARAGAEGRPPIGPAVPPGFPTSPESIRDEARNREHADPVVLRELVALVALCLGVLLVLALYAM